METALIVSLVAGGVAMTTAVANYLLLRRNTDATNRNARAIEAMRGETEKAKEERQRQREVTKYSEPLARAAYDLQSRIHNILCGQFIETFLAGGSPRDRQYVVENTAFVIAQFFCWSEILRRAIRFIPLDRDDRTSQLSSLQDRIDKAWGTDDYPPCLRLFSGEQRAVGEALIRSGPDGLFCLGYGGFLKEISRSMEALVDAIRDDIASLAGGVDAAAERLTRVQHALIDLLDLLDPDALRFPRDRRDRVPVEPT